MKFKILPHQLEFIFPFKIAHTTRTHTDGAYLEIRQGSEIGIGEIVFPPYYPESLASFTAFMEKVSLPKELSFETLPAFLDTVEKSIQGNYFAKAALDIALHNLLVKVEKKGIEKHYEISGANLPTSFTLGISSNEIMLEKLQFAQDFSYIKLKVDETEMERIVNFYTNNCDKQFVVDANQGFKNKELALDWCIELNKKGVAYLEQPFQKEDFTSHQWLTERSPIPILADESFQTIFDIEQIKNSFHGVNVKLMKCGGIYSAFKCLQKAKEMGLKTVLGCMSESSVAVDAAAHLSPLADWADLDGPFLLK